jgi:hypothetical protein
LMVNLPCKPSNLFPSTSIWHIVRLKMSCKALVSLIVIIVTYVFNVTHKFEIWGIFLCD